ncbi:MAG: hypothetical protein V3V56_07155 [bacterium]
MKRLALLFLAGLLLSLSMAFSAAAGTKCEERNAALNAAGARNAAGAADPEDALRARVREEVMAVLSAGEERAAT